MLHAALAVLLLSSAFAAAETPEEIRAKIVVYEARVAADTGFNWEAHNELRHLYSGLDPDRALHHSDVILAHSVMDDYILHILSGWHLDKEPALAMAALEAVFVDPRRKYVMTACVIKAGDLAAGLGDLAKARFLYKQVAANRDPDVAAYRSLADVRLRQLKDPASGYALWGLAGAPLVAFGLIFWARARRRRLRERLAQGARALGARRTYEVCRRVESTGGARLWPWYEAGLLLVHRGQAVFLSERGEEWLGEGCVASWNGWRAGAPWFALEGRGRKHYFTAEPGVWPFGSERATRGLLAKLEEDLSSPGKVRGAAL